MKIELEKNECEKLENFKDGEGYFLRKKYQEDGFIVMNACLKENCSIGLHVHKNEYEIIRIISGIGKMICNGEVEILKPGDVHICKENQRHTFKNENKEDLIFFATVIKSK